MPALPRRPALAAVALAVAALAACRPVARTAPEPTRQAAEEAARRAIAAEGAIRPDTFPTRSVGVGPFAAATNDTVATPLAYALADLLLTDLSRSGQLQVVDRLRTGALLGELQLTAAGAVDPATAPRVGRLLGARRVVVGALAGSPDGTLRIDARLADIETGQVGAAVDASAPLERVLDAEKAVAFRLFDALGVTLSPGERRLVEQRPTRSVAALLAYGRAVRAEVLGDLDAARGHYESAARLDPGFRAAGARAASLRTEGGAGGARRAARLAASQINRSLADGHRARSEAGSDPAFMRAQSSVIVIIVRTVP